MTPRRRLLLLGGAAAVVAAWFGVGRPATRIARLAGTGFRPPVDLREDHIDWFRQIRFAWQPLIEGGAPMVDPAGPYGPDRGMPSHALHLEIMDLLVWLLANRPLAAGTYPLANLDQGGMHALIRAEVAGLPADRQEAVVASFQAPFAEDGFAFSAAHGQLLPALAWTWPSLTLAPLLTNRVRLGASVPIVDFKRPFGDATAFELDIATLLDLPRPETPEDGAVLFQRYQELWPALQTYVQNVPLGPGAL